MVRMQREEQNRKSWLVVEKHSLNNKQDLRLVIVANLVGVLLSL